MPLNRRVDIKKGKLVYIVKIDKWGRICIPKEVRELISGDSFALEITKDGKILLDPIKLEE